MMEMWNLRICQNELSNFFRVFNGIKVLNDPNGLILDFTFSKVVWSLIIIVCLEMQ